MIDALVSKIPDSIIEDAIRMHKHLAPGIILGFKMAARALKELTPSQKDLVMLTSETTRCIPDGLQAVSRYLLVNGGYKIYTRTYDVGKLSIQVSMNYKDAFRLVLDDHYTKQHEVLHAWVFLPKDDQTGLERIREAMWDIDINEAFTLLPFEKHIKPRFKGKNIETCPSCGEATNALSMITIDGRRTCKTCAFFEKSSNHEG